VECGKLFCGKPEVKNLPTTPWGKGSVIPIGGVEKNLLLSDRKTHFSTIHKPNNKSNNKYL